MSAWLVDHHTLDRGDHAANCRSAVWRLSTSNHQLSGRTSAACRLLPRRPPRRRQTTSSGRTSAACRLPCRPPGRRQTLHQVDGPVPPADSCHVDHHINVKHYIKWTDQCRMQTPATSTTTLTSNTTSSGRTSAACRLLPRRPPH